jgi:hypothetical protein
MSMSIIAGMKVFLILARRMALILSGLQKLARAMSSILAKLELFMILVIIDIIKILLLFIKNVGILKDCY